MLSHTTTELPPAQGTFLPYGQEWNPQLTTNHYKFTGKERDAESGLDFFGARFYSSAMGRWMSPDWADKPEPVPYADLADPQSLNLYGYVRNNPMSHADADGHACPGCLGETGFIYIPSGSVSGELNRLQTVLSGASFVPGAYGRAAAGLNAVISYFRGNRADAAGNAMAAAIPGGGRLTKAEQILKNAADGKAFENVVQGVKSATQTDLVKNITLETESGARTVMDFVGNKADGQIGLTEAKASATAPLSPAQTVTHPEIEATGATVVGQGKPPFVGGTRIPPTKVDVIRPADLNKPE